MLTSLCRRAGRLLYGVVAPGTLALAWGGAPAPRSRAAGLPPVPRLAKVAFCPSPWQLFLHRTVLDGRRSLS